MLSLLRKAFGCTAGEWIPCSYEEADRVFRNNGGETPMRHRDSPRRDLTKTNYKGVYASGHVYYNEHYDKYAYTASGQSPASGRIIARPGRANYQTVADAYAAMRSTVDEMDAEFAYNYKRKQELY